jgi:hypothetical protein
VFAFPAAATAASKGNARDNFWRSCDAMVFIQDDLTGASNIDAYGGFSCTSADKVVGVVRVELLKNGRMVALDSRPTPANGTTTLDAGATVSDPGGNQNWSARLRITGAGFPQSGVDIVTGVLVS